MRILFMLTRFPVLSQTFVLNQMTGLLDRGHDVSISAAEFMTDQQEQAVVSGYRLRERVVPSSMPLDSTPGIKGVLGDFPVPWFKQKAHGLLLEWQRRRERRALRDRSFDVIQCHFGPSGIRAAALKKEAGLQGSLVVSFHGYDVHSFVRRAGPEVYEEVFDQASLVTGNSDFVVEKLRELGAEEAVKRHPMGIDPEVFDYAYEPVGEGERVEFLSVARLVECKGLQYALRALAKLQEEPFDFRYTIIGDGPRRETLEEMARSLGIRSNVRFLGARPRSEVRAEFGRAHIFLFPSVTGINGDTEGQGLVLQEAQACGLPVVTTWTGGIPQSVVPGESALMAPERDAGAFAGQIAKLIDDPERCRQMGRRGRGYVRDEFDIRDLNDRLVDLYRGVLSNHAG